MKIFYFIIFWYILLYPGDQSHIPEVDGSNPLPPTSNYKGLEGISQASNPFFNGFSNEFLTEFQKALLNPRSAFLVLFRSSVNPPGLHISLRESSGGSQGVFWAKQKNSFLFSSYRRMGGEEGGVH